MLVQSLDAPGAGFRSEEVLPERRESANLLSADSQGRGDVVCRDQGLQPVSGWGLRSRGERGGSSPPAKQKGAAEKDQHRPMDRGRGWNQKRGLLSRRSVRRIGEGGPSIAKTFGS